MPKQALLRKTTGPATGAKAAGAKATPAQQRWLRCGLTQPGGKLPLFDTEGQLIPANTVKSCIRRGWAEPWFENPLKKDWLVCRLTHLGRVVAEER
jgi:hypothetical protein